MVQSSKIILLSAAATGLGLAMWKVFKSRKLRKSDDSSSSNGKNQITVEDATFSNFDSPPAEDYNIHEVDAPESLNIDSEEQYSQLQVEEDDSSQLQVDEDNSSELRSDADGSSHVQASEQKSLQTASLLEHADETSQLISSTAVSATSDSKLNKKSNYFKKVVVCLRVDEANNRNDETALPDSITYDKAVSLKNRLFSDEKSVFLATLNEILKASAFPVNHAVFRESGVVPLMKNMLLEEKFPFDSERLLLQALGNFAADPENRNYLKQSCVPYLIGNYLKTKDKHHHREVVNLLVSLSSEIDEEYEVHYSKIIPHIFTEMYACRKGQKNLRQINLSFLVNLSTNKALCHAMIPNLDKKYETYFHEKCNEEETLVKLLALLDNIFGHVVFLTDNGYSVELPSGAERECFLSFCKFLKNKLFFKELSKHQNDEIRIEQHEFQTSVVMSSVNDMMFNNASLVE
ncbi:Halomucin [Trichinella spiralis]|uniref:Halomucin n=1 Tax=Trichinella spiralis TaxID=6334 RepID=A0ABR3KZQ0_TRISP